MCAVLRRAYLKYFMKGTDCTMKILSVNDAAFGKYGRVITNVDFTSLVEELKKTPVPEGVAYEPSVSELEALPVMKRAFR